MDAVLVTCNAGLKDSATCACILLRFAHCFNPMCAGAGAILVLVLVLVVVVVLVHGDSYRYTSRPGPPRAHA